jgi:DNA polymerase elongation subunit (family B)
MTTYVAFDIETMPNLEMLDRLPSLAIKIEIPELKIGNLKDPEKIAAKEAEHAARVRKIEEDAYTEYEKKIQEQEDNMCLDPLTGLIASAAFTDRDGNETVLFDETEVLNTMWQHLMNGDTLVTFNGKGFDLPFCFKRGILLGLKWATIPNMKKYTDKYRAKQHIDVMEEWCEFGKRIKLDTLGNYLLGARKVEFDFREIPELLKTGEGRAKIAEYNLQDARLTLDIAEKIGLLV